MRSRRDVGEADIDRYLERDRRGPRAVGRVAGRVQADDGRQPERPPFDVDEWAARQVYIALGQFMACAAVLGVDTCPMEGIDPDKYDEVLGIAAQGIAPWSAVPRATGQPTTSTP